MKLAKKLVLVLLLLTVVASARKRDPLTKDDRKDFKKGLKEVIEADDKFELKLRTLKSAIDTDPLTKKEAHEFQFALQDAQEALKSNADMAREYMSEKESDAPAKKK